MDNWIQMYVFLPKVWRVSVLLWRWSPCQKPDQRHWALTHLHLHYLRVEPVISEIPFKNRNLKLDLLKSLSLRFVFSCFWSTENIWKGRARVPLCSAGWSKIASTLVTELNGQGSVLQPGTQWSLCYIGLCKTLPKLMPLPLGIL